ncbi:uncharacterized protein UV8b_04330 [Ustilaginoidea virens]|uniref:Uncharacterized protein n=1 Tax=Ustilaginoidea virens TaxID=1159556 RepID=A0A1B5KU91_USTVR|nr:uncharacterized protein UV8b_04330 [Ustilaginoidea virens]QUC20089.1 hypothetical protein UV8b_04330 [Ustilaginoidea virens]GAO14527.1 hypothetical protein UVI_02032380 [Ustilaginoidea virens]
MPSPSSDSNGQSETEPRPRGQTVNILSFFKPVEPLPLPLPLPPPSDDASPNSEPKPPIPRPRSPPSSSPLSSEPPSTPPAPAVTEIRASDDEASDDDDSLVDISCLIGATSRTSVPARHDDPYSTPRAKRTAAAGLRSSPLAVTPRHKFDLKALAKDARSDDAAVASSLKVHRPAAAPGESGAEGFAADAAVGRHVAGVVKDKGGQDAHRVLRAVRRSEPACSQHRYLFFADNHGPPDAPEPPSLPKGSPWHLLTQGSVESRERHLTSGLPQTILRKKGGLPDSLFEWMLDSLCAQSSAIIRQEYCNMIASCPEQVGRLLTADRARQVFIRLGARDLGPAAADLAADLAVSSSDDMEPYDERDWSCLKSFISLLGLVAGRLTVRAAAYAAQTLVQLALDSLLISNVDVLCEFEYTIQQLADAIPGPSWNSFCSETCSLVNTRVDSCTVKTTALSCLPVCSRRTHDLRRRIAVADLFHDDALAARSPEDVVTLRSIIDLLSGERFAIRQSTDFSELRASVILVNIAVDDGSVASFDDADGELDFNAQVDELAGRLREIWRKTNDSGMKLSRTEAKSVVEWVQQRLAHSVRTRPKAKKSVFDLPGQQKDLFLPRQREYMKRFLAIKPKSTLAEEAEAEEQRRRATELDADTIVVAAE